MTKTSVKALCRLVELLKVCVSVCLCYIILVGPHYFKGLFEGSLKLNCTLIGYKEYKNEKLNGR